MNIYETWIYEHLINTQWFLWGVIGTLFAANFGSGLLIWFVLRGTKK